MRTRKKGRLNERLVRLASRMRHLSFRSFYCFAQTYIHSITWSTADFGQFQLNLNEFYSRYKFKSLEFQVKRYTKFCCCSNGCWIYAVQWNHLQFCTIVDNFVVVAIVSLSPVSCATDKSVYTRQSSAQLRTLALAVFSSADYVHSCSKFHLQVKHNAIRNDNITATQ